MAEAEQWTKALQAWAIPEEILAAAPESPWGFPTALFERRVDEAPAEPTPSTRRALEVMQPGDTVLDVGCGAGAGAMPLAIDAGQLIGVDPSASMLHAFQRRAGVLHVPVITIEGNWPEVADQTPVADLVVCHNVAYNVQNLAPFAQHLTNHARRRVILELHAEHPMSTLNDLWMRFHNLERPTTPTADNALAVLRELGYSPEREDWIAPGLFSWGGPNARAEMVAWVRKRLCLPEARDPEIEEALAVQFNSGQTTGFPPRQAVTLWWDGTAR